MKALWGIVLISLVAMINCQDPTIQQLACIRRYLGPKCDLFGIISDAVYPCGVCSDELYDDFVSDIVVDFLSLP